MTGAPRCHRGRCPVVVPLLHGPQLTAVLAVARPDHVRKPVERSQMKSLNQQKVYQMHSPDISGHFLRHELAAEDEVPQLGRVGLLLCGHVGVGAVCLQEPGALQREVHALSAPGKQGEVHQFCISMRCSFKDGQRLGEQLSKMHTAWLKEGFPYSTIMTKANTCEDTFPNPQDVSVERMSCHVYLE